MDILAKYEFNCNIFNEKEIQYTYFFEVNIKYIPSNVLKISAFSRVKYFWYLPKKSKFSFYFILFRTITESRPL